MTKEEILAMKPGKELSGLVAVEIMGRTCAQEVFLYCSTDISAAWQVVEKIRESDQYNFGRLNKKPKDNQVATATDFREQYDDTFISFCSELMDVLGIDIKEFSYPATLTIMRKLSPEVICKAALLIKHS